MDRERLAAYVAGELDAAERAAIEARLARDPALRVEVDRLAAVEQALGRLSPATPRDGFEQRLRDAVGPTLDAVLAGEPTGDDGSGQPAPPRPGDDAAARPAPGVAPDAAPSPGSGEPGDEPEHGGHSAGDGGAWTAAGDELAARRRPPRWVGAVSGAAAAVVLLGVAGVALLGLPGDDDVVPDAAFDAVDEAESPETADGPVVVASGRDLDPDALERLLDEPTLERLRARDLDAEAGDALAARYRQQLQAPGDAGDTPDPEDDAAPEIAEDAPATESAPDATRQHADPATVARCLDALLAGAPAPSPIPVYVELVRYEDRPAVAYGLLTAGPDGRYQRTEVWVVDAEDCQVRELRQRDAS